MKMNLKTILFVGSTNYFAHLFIILLLSLGLSACASWFKPTLQQDITQIRGGEYGLDKDHATILFKVDHMGFSTFVGRFNDFDARLTFDPKKPTEATLEATVNMASVDVNNEKFERALRGKWWLQTESYPQAIFRTTSAKQLGADILEFEGELTFLGHTETISLNVKVNGAANNLLTGKYTLGFSANTSFSRSTFGLDRYVPTVGDKVSLEIYAEFQKLAN